MTYDPTTWVDDGPPCINAANLNNMEVGIDRAQGDVMNLYGLTAAIPASDPLLVGRLYFESDLLFRVWRDNGAGWDQVHTVAGGAWTLIAETILGAPAAAVTFAAIPGTYRALVTLGLARTDRVAEVDAIGLRANGDAGGNYDWRRIHNIATNAVLGATEARLGIIEAANSNANGFGLFQMYCYGYALTTLYKCFATVTHGPFGNMSAIGDLILALYNNQWRSTAAITSYTYFPLVGPNFVAGSHFALYGIT